MNRQVLKYIVIALIAYTIVEYTAIIDFLSFGNISKNVMEFIIFTILIVVLYITLNESNKIRQKEEIKILQNKQLILTAVSSNILKNKFWEFYNTDDNLGTSQLLYDHELFHEKEEQTYVFNGVKVKFKPFTSYLTSVNINNQGDLYLLNLANLGGAITSLKNITDDLIYDLVFLESKLIDCSDGLKEKVSHLLIEVQSFNKELFNMDTDLEGRLIDPDCGEYHLAKSNLEIESCELLFKYLEKHGIKYEYQPLNKSNFRILDKNSIHQCTKYIRNFNNLFLR